MTGFYTRCKPINRIGVYIIVLFGFSIGLLILSRNFIVFSDWYVNHIFPWIGEGIGRISSIFTFSIFEAGILVLLGYLLFVVLKIVWLLLFHIYSAKVYVKKSGISMLVILSSLLMLYTVTGGMNYNRSPLSKTAGLPVQQSSKEELLQLSAILIGDLNRLLLDGNLDNDSILDQWQQASVRKGAIDAMKGLGESYPSLTGYYSYPKPIYFSEDMSYLGIRGIFSPFTMEANYNDDIYSANIPYVICHELAHSKGYMREEEANFLAYLACINSPSERFQYSGTINALGYVLNALKKETGRDEFDRIYQSIPEQVRTGFRVNSIYSEQHSSSLTTLSRSVNDLYLHANAVTTGVKSYGQMVDLLLAEYADRIKQEGII